MVAPECLLMTSQQKPPGATGDSYCDSGLDQDSPDQTIPRVHISFLDWFKMGVFLNLFNDNRIRSFLRMDSCYLISDKYLLAMTFVYFRRASLSLKEYTSINFFRALYLANSMEEDDEDNAYEIFVWALGRNWRNDVCDFMRQKNRLWQRMGFRAAVSRSCCEQVMAMAPTHFVWQRERHELHGWAMRKY